MARPSIPLIIRFARYVDPSEPDACWPWKGALDQGYGVTSFCGGQKLAAHRAAWLLAHGPIPNGLFVCHRCDNPPCVNPTHLFLGTQGDNMDDMIAKGRKVIGEQCRQTVLTIEQVREVRRSRETGVVLAQRFGVTTAAISLIRRGKNWRHIS